MLEPTKRVLYLEELSPPEGYSLDGAIATTYSLDLVSLLMAPMSMALMEMESKEELMEDPMALLEALRRTTGRFGIFCQRGRITIPRTESLLYSYLEPAVVEVEAPTEDGVFHPKIWLLRFTAEEKPTFYRCLCLSRNLTEDRSWDTAMVLEGELIDRNNAYARNHPLGDFISNLGQLATSPVPEDIQDHTALMEDEVRRVDFEVPDQFRDENPDDLAFAPSGLEDVSDGGPEPAGCNRQMVISPFLSDSQVRKLAEHGKENVLVSRADALDGLSDKTHATLQEDDTEIFVLDDGAENPDQVAALDRGENATVEKNETDDAEEQDIEEATQRFSGLHAKLYLIEHDTYDTWLWTGSANATFAGLKGKNVEFMVGLRGWKRDIGIDELLGDEEDAEEKEVTCLRDLLRPYTRSEPSEEVEARQKVEKKLENVRTALSAAELQMEASQNQEGTYDLTIKAAEAVDIPDNAVEGRCFPVTQGPNAGRSICGLLEDGTIQFRNVAPSDLTQFVGFRLRTEHDDQEGSIGFVLNVPADGFPEDRDERILGSLLSDEQKFIRYLLFLLSEEESFEAVDPIIDSLLSRQNNQGPGERLFDEVPLFEQLVKAYSRSPEKIEKVAALMQDLEDGRVDEDVIPDEFLSVWETFEAAREGEL